MLLQNGQCQWANIPIFFQVFFYICNLFGEPSSETCLTFINTSLRAGTLEDSSFMRQTTDDFWGLHKNNKNCEFPLYVKFVVEKQQSNKFLSRNSRPVACNGEAAVQAVENI